MASRIAHSLLYVSPSEQLTEPVAQNSEVQPTCATDGLIAEDTELRTLLLLLLGLHRLGLGHRVPRLAGSLVLHRDVAALETGGLLQVAAAGVGLAISAADRGVDLGTADRATCTRRIINAIIQPVCTVLN